MQNLVTAAKALSDPNRIRILEALQGGELCVCELCDGLRMSQSTLSTHLAVLRRAGLAGARKEGRWAYYRLHPLGLALIRALFPQFAAEMARDRRLVLDRRRFQQGRSRSAELCTTRAQPRPSSNTP